MGIGATAVGNRWVKIKARGLKDKELVKNLIKWNSSPAPRNGQLVELAVGRRA